MFITSEAIVLNKVKYNDNTLIVSLFTKECGSVSFVVHIAKTAKANVKNNILQPLNIVSVEWDNNSHKNLQHIRNLQMSNYYSTLNAIPMKNLIASFLSELLFHGLKNEHENEETFDFIKKSLIWLDENEKGIANFHLLFMLQFSSLLGLCPNMMQYDMPCFFDLLNGSFVKQQPNHGYFMNREDTAMIRQFYDMDYSSMGELQINGEMRIRMIRQLNTFYRLHLPEFPQLKSIEILHEVVYS